MSYENLYQGSDLLFNPNYTLPTYKGTGTQVDVGDFAMSTDPRTANQLSELNHKLNPGLQRVEISGIQPDVVQSIPDQHLDEMRRIGELTGTELSWHGSLVEASGVNGQQGLFDETQRFGAEKTLISDIIRAQKVNPDGNMSFTVHSSVALPETEDKIKIKEKGKEVEVLEKYYVVNPISGQINVIPRRDEYFPETGKFEPEKQEFSPEKAIQRINRDQWTGQLANINQRADFGAQSYEQIKRITESKSISEETINAIAKGANIENLKTKNNFEKDNLKNIERSLNHAQIYYRESYRELKGLFDQAWVGANEDDKRKLKEYAHWAENKVYEGFENDPEKIKQLGEVVEKGIKVLGNLNKIPQSFKPLREFAIEKAAQTFGNVATAAYKKYGDKAPILNIENPPAGQSGLNRAEDIRELIKESRTKMVENLKKQGLSSGQAKEASEKLIGATWDVGHINMIRKKGYSEKDVIEDTKKIAPYVKNVHLSDNFGLDHTELPMGMGNVPIKEMLEKIEKAGYKGQKVIEAGNWWQHFSDRGGGSPFKPTIEAFDSPLYGMEAGPSWYQASGMFPGYYGGHGPIQTPIHHQQFGAGFQNLPVDLGGEIPGGRDRMSGTPLQ
jgi:hypothetical protein